MSEPNSRHVNAKWDDATHLLFLELCEKEVRKGNRPNSYLSKDGKKNMSDEFSKMTGRNYTQLQMKNHWGCMKKEWSLFKQLIRGETGLGWDATKKIIIADDDWWERKIKENAKYRKFRNKDLSLIWFRYDALFVDIVATGEEARAANQEQMSDIRVDLDEDELNGIDGYNKERFTNSKGEKSDESDDMQNVDFVMFPEPSLKREKCMSGVGSGSQVKKSKTKSASSSIKQEIHSLVDFISNQSTATSPRKNEPTIEKCIDMLTNISDMPEGSEMFNYSVNMLLKKEMRQVFCNLSNDEARKSWLEYNYQLFMKKM